MNWLKGLEDSINKINSGESFKIIDEAEKEGYEMKVSEVVDLNSNETTYEIEIYKNGEHLFNIV